MFISLPQAHNSLGLEINLDHYTAEVKTEDMQCC